MARSLIRLADAVHAARCGEDLVLLDVAQDQYFCLPQAAAGVRLDAAAGTISGLGEDWGEDLRAAGLLGDAARPERRLAVAPAAEAIVCSDDEGRGSELLPLLLLSVLRAGRFGRPFAELVSRQKIGRPAGSDVTPAARLGAAFQASLPWLPVQGACLYQSFLLLELLRGRGLAADWVFGVRTWPFHAHCWVQAEAVVLNDTVDHVASFEPIMVV